MKKVTCGLLDNCGSFQAHAWKDRREKAISKPPSTHSCILTLLLFENKYIHTYPQITLKTTDWKSDVRFGLGPAVGSLCSPRPQGQGPCMVKRPCVFLTFSWEPATGPGRHEHLYRQALQLAAANGHQITSWAAVHSGRGPRGDWGGVQNLSQARRPEVSADWCLLPPLGHYYHTQTWGYESQMHLEQKLPTAVFKSKSMGRRLHPFPPQREGVHPDLILVTGDSVRGFPFTVHDLNISKGQRAQPQSKRTRTRPKPQFSRSTVSGASGYPIHSLELQFLQHPRVLW